MNAVEDCNVLCTFPNGLLVDDLVEDDLLSKLERKEEEPNKSSVLLPPVENKMNN